MSMKRVGTVFTAEEWEEVEGYLNEKEVSIYELLKKAVLEKVRNSGPLDKYLEKPEGS